MTTEEILISVLGAVLAAELVAVLYLFRVARGLYRVAKIQQAQIEQLR